MVTVFALFSLMAAIVSVLMGATTLFWNPRSSLNRIFALLCFSIAYWAFMESMMRHSTSYDEAFFFIRALFLFPLSIALFLHFSLIFAGREKILKNPATYVLIYGPTTVVSLLYLSFSQMRGSPVPKFWGWSYGSPEWTFASDISILVVSSMAALAVYVCLKYYLAQTDVLAKNRARYVLAGLLIPAVFGLFSEGLLPVVHVKIPELTNVSFAIGCAGLIGYAIIKYDLFISAPAIPAEKILSVMYDSLFLVNPEGIIVTANESSLKLLGYEENELKGNPISALSDICLDSLFGNDSQAENGHHVSELETNLKSKVGVLTPVMISGAPSYDKSGRLQGYILVARDITERKKADSTLRDSEERYRTLFDTSPDGIAMTDLSGKIIMCNRVIANMRGFDSPEEMVGRNSSEFVVPDERQTVAASMPEVITHGLRNIEYNSLKKDGTSFPVEVSASAMFDPDGNPQAILAFLRDITDRKKAEEALRDSEQRFRKIFEEGPLGMSIVGLDFRFVKVNRTLAQMVGYSEKALRGTRFADITHPEDVNNDMDAGKRLISGEIPSYRSEKRYLKSSGEQVWINLFVSLVRDEKGNPLYFLGMMEDITDSKQAEEQILKQSSQLEFVNQELLALNRISAAVSQTIELDDLLHLALRTVTDLDIFKVSRKAGILLVEGDKLRLVSHLGHPASFLKAHERLSIDNCLCGEAARTGKLIVSTGAYEDKRHTIRYQGMENHGHAIVPLMMGNRVAGVMYLYLPPGVDVSERKRQLLLTIGTQIAIAIENARLYEKTKSLSLHDPLTSLANRNLMNIELEKSAAMAKRTGKPYSLIMLDLDHFKHYNDTYGHTAGDRLLSDIGEILKSEVREIDLVARYGGEEFLVILPETDSAPAIEVAERIRAAIGGREFYYADDRPPTSMTVSLGVASYGADVANSDVLIARADSSLYRAKENGRNRVEAWLPKLA